MTQRFFIKFNPDTGLVTERVFYDVLGEPPSQESTEVTRELFDEIKGNSEARVERRGGGNAPLTVREIAG